MIVRHFLQKSRKNMSAYQLAIQYYVFKGKQMIVPQSGFLL